MTSRINTVLFDLGDTLWHFPSMPPVEVVREATISHITRLLEGWGFEVTPEHSLLGRYIKLAVEEETERAFHGDCLDPGYADVCRRVAASHGLELTSAQGEELWDTWNLGGAFLGRVLFPDALETLHWLKERGYRLGSVTNRGWAGPLFQQEMRDLGLAELFEVVAVSCEVGYVKPHPRIFQYALDCMGVEPGVVVMVGDSLRGDVEGAQALGITAVWRRPPLGEPVEETEDKPEALESVVPDYTVDTLSELRNLPIFVDGGPGK